MRPGRCDYTVELPAAQPEAAAQLFLSFFARHPLHQVRFGSASSTSATHFGMPFGAVGCPWLRSNAAPKIARTADRKCSKAAKFRLGSLIYLLAANPTTTPSQAISLSTWSSAAAGVASAPPFQRASVCNSFSLRVLSTADRESPAAAGSGRIPRRAGSAAAGGGGRVQHARRSVFPIHAVARGGGSGGRRNWNRRAGSGGARACEKRGRGGRRGGAGVVVPRREAWCGLEAYQRE